jgi:cation diffusion facilitator family transporter
MPHNTKTEHQEKTIVALSSVGAAVGLTTLKIVVALLTGSLGILAEATHSGLDLVAALMTFFAVRFADRPADATHNYGHAKVENLSALAEVGLLLLTAVWIIYEALQRLLFHDALVHITIWAFLVMLVSIGVDYTRSRALLRVARKLGSQALEADALHFSTDIWSSLVVIAGLAMVYLVEHLPLPAWFGYADAIAALGVSGIVIWVSLRLARETIDALLDRAPGELIPQMQEAIARVEHVTEVRRNRIRRTGNKYFADIIIAAPRTLTFEQTHTLTEQVEQAVMESVHTIYPQGETDIVVHVEPTTTPEETVTDQIHYLAELQGVHAHDIHVRNVGGRLEADFDLEVQSDMNLHDAHEVATRLETAVLQGNQQLRRVTTHLEAPTNEVVQRQDVTTQYSEMAGHIRRIADCIAGDGSAHDIHLYRSQAQSVELNRYEQPGQALPELDLVLHTTFEAHIPLSQVHSKAEEIKRSLRQAYPFLGSVIIHTEPPESWVDFHDDSKEEKS